MMETMARALRTLVLLGASVVAAGGATALNAATLLGLTDTGELFTSADGGTTWVVRATLPVSDAQAVSAGTTSEELFLVSRSGVVYRSHDAGATWSATGTVAAFDIVDMLIRSSGDIYLLAASGTVWHSSDEGATFGATATLTAPNYVSLTGGSGEDIVYALTRTGEVAKSTDLGTTWSVVGTIATSEAVDIRSLGPDLYVITGPGDVSRSSDAGETWLPIGTVSQVHMAGLTAHEDGLVAVSREGLTASSEDATSWVLVGSIDQLNVVALGHDTPTTTSVREASSGLPGLRVRSVWPNPAGNRDGSATVAFEVSQATRVSARMYTVAGRLLAAQDVGSFSRAGSYRFSFHVGDYPSGVYYIRLETENGTSTPTRITITR